jgi:hypothetical protein
MTHSRRFDPTAGRQQRYGGPSGLLDSSLQPAEFESELRKQTRIDSVWYDDISVPLCYY